MNILELDGFLGTRADFLVDLVLLSFIVLPFILLFSFKLARKMAYELHQKIQITTLVVVLIMVILLEIDIQFSSLSNIMSKSSFHGTFIFNILLSIHILVAVSTLLAWLYLSIKSLKTLKKSISGEFSAFHKQLGMLVFAGVCFTSVSGAAIYIATFIY